MRLWSAGLTGCRQIWITFWNDSYNLLLYLFSCKRLFLVIEYINVTTVRSSNPDADCHPGLLESLTAILTVKE